MIGGRLDSAIIPRFECKYWIDSRTVSEIREFIRPFTQLDPYASQNARRGDAYVVCSLYLDSRDLSLYQQTVGGEKKRFKLRARCYSDEPEAPVFLEVKQRHNVVLHKTRAKVSRKVAHAVLEGDLSGGTEDLDQATHDALHNFTHRMGLIDAVPLVRVKYLREALVAASGEPTRITFDWNLQHAVTLGTDLSLERGEWLTTPLDGTILEIKFSERFPFWVDELVHRFSLEQRSIPKYVMSVDHMLMGGRKSALSLDGFILPPQRWTGIPTGFHPQAPWKRPLDG